jgi:transposase
MTEFILSDKERIRLQQVVSNSRDAHLVLRAYALLWLDDGDSISEIAQRLCVSRQSVYNWANRFHARASDEFLSRLADATRSGRPCIATGIIDPLIDAVIDFDPRQLGYRSTVWTAPLLVEYLRQHHQVSVSDDSVRLAIERLRIRWKRPRHRLALRSETWRQAKGG